MLKSNIFITSDNFMIIFYEGVWTDGKLTFGSDHRGPEIMAGIFVSGTFCEESMLIESDLSRYESIRNVCSYGTEKSEASDGNPDGLSHCDS